MKKFWLCGQYKSESDAGVVWEFQGIFDAKQKAIAACKSVEYFIAPVSLNTQTPKETAVFKNFYYPLAGD